MAGILETIGNIFKRIDHKKEVALFSERGAQLSDQVYDELNKGNLKLHGMLRWKQ